MKVWKKLAGVVLALAVMMTLCVMAGATSATLSSGVAKDGTTPYNYDVIDNTLTIPKSITVTGSTDLSAVYGPTVTYVYVVSPATVTGITVNDGTHPARPVRAGVANGLSLSDAEFTSSAVTLTSGTGSVTANVTATVDLSRFSAPGIYRYAITEAAANTAALYAAGVTRPAEDAFFLDVYIKNDTDTNGDATRSVYGYVLLKANESITTTNAATYKVSEFTTDSYATMDFTVTKSVTGNMGDKTNEFPFTINVDNSGMYFYSGETTVGTTAATTAEFTPTLKDGDSFVIKGLNPKATVTVTETNNTPDVYTVSVQDNASPTKTVFVTAAEVAAQGTKATNALAVSNYDTANSDTNVTTAPTASVYNVITFINNLDAISPTGVVLRYAPYLAMMGAGVVALPLSMRKKKEEMF